MEQLRALGAQLLAIWSQLGVNQKLTVAASGFIVAVTLAVVVFFTSRTDFVLLYGGILITIRAWGVDYCVLFVRNAITAGSVKIRCHIFAERKIRSQSL